MREGAIRRQVCPLWSGGECGAHFLRMFLSKVHVERGSGNVQRELGPYLEAGMVYDLEHFTPRAKRLIWIFFRCSVLVLVDYS
jgi:hypothetical protein